MIVPYAPGATGDIGGRLYGEELGKVLGQTVVVDNKTGAGGTIAMAELARAPADGYTLSVVAQGTLPRIGSTHSFDDVHCHTLLKSASHVGLLLKAFPSLLQPQVLIFEDR